MDDIEFTKRDPLHSYKAVCAKLGLIMCVYYICRILNGLVLYILLNPLRTLGDSGSYIIQTAIAVLFTYIIPILIAAVLFHSFERYKGKFRELYKKPRRLARTFGSLPATYGLGVGVALLTFLTSLLISRLSGGQSFVEDLFRPTTIEPSTNIPSMLTMVFLLVVIAPIFEEFFVRGILYDALKPFGCGMAIIISSVVFGLMHGSLYMLFYSTALGFALGYLRYATGSIFVSTIFHAMINAISAGLLVLSSLREMLGEGHKSLNTIASTYMLAMVVLMIVGVIAFIRKIPVIRKYRIDNNWPEVGAGKKTALFFLSIPVILMLVFAFNEHTNNWLVRLIIR